METKRVGTNYEINTGYDVYTIDQDKLNSCIDVVTDKFTDLFVFLDDVHDNNYDIYDTIDDWTKGKIRDIVNQLKYAIIDIENLNTQLIMDEVKENSNVY